jgi:hypothetical protein
VIGSAWRSLHSGGEANTHDVMTAAVTAIVTVLATAFGGWLLSLLPVVRNWVEAHPTITTILLSGLVAALVTFSALGIYTNYISLQLHQLQAQIDDLNSTKTQIASIQAELSNDTWKGGILAAGTIKGGQLVVSTVGVSFDPVSGRISFPNPRGLKFAPVTSALSPNSQYLTETCYTKSAGTDYFILWQGPLDTGGRNHPPSDCMFAVAGT